MANLKLIVDGQTQIDGDPSAWNDNPPPMLTDQLKAGARHAPWMRAALMPLADAITREAAKQAGLPIPPATGEWTLHVTHNGDDTIITVQSTP